MRLLTEKQLEEFNEVIDKAMFGVAYSKLRFEDNPFAFRVEIMGDCGETFALEKCNALFHELGLLDDAKNLGIGDADTYCELSRFPIAGKQCYIASFNHPKVLKFKLGTGDERFVLSKQRWNLNFDAKYKMEIMQMINDLNSGRIRGKLSEGRFVMEDYRYDKVAAGEEDREWLLLSRGKLKRSIGIKTVRLYRDDGTLKPKTYMRWEVKAVNLVDANENECDATNVPPGFWPENILIRLGKRLPNEQ